jgi:cytochrome c-type protein NapB
MSRLLPSLLLCIAGAVPAQDPNADAPSPPPPPYRSLDALRRGAPLARVENLDLRRRRDFPEQPPTIPHSIDGYQLDARSNRCMVCHSRSGSETFQAPMVSVTHFMDRDGQVLAEVSPRRYFCVQCHVVQTDARLLIGNGFTDADALITPAAPEQRAPR